MELALQSSGKNGLLACPECDLLLHAREAPAGSAAKCPRCGCTLYKGGRRGLEYAIALHVTALVLFIMANSFKFITFKLEGRENASTLISGVFEFAKQDLWVLAIVVFCASIAFPLVKILTTLYVIVPVHLGRVPPHGGRVFRFVEMLSPWAMMEVFLLGVIVAYVKLIDLATLDLGPAIFSFGALIFVLAAGESAIERREVWNALGPSEGKIGDSRSQRSIHYSCHSCGFLLFGSHKDGHEPHCPRCATHLHYRKPNSLTRTWALLMTAIVLYIPANVFPVMTVISFGKGQPDTILSGVFALIDAGMWPLAAIVFFASITVPVLKIIGLIYILISVERGSNWRPRDRTFLYRVIEQVGRWSMIDVFMISILIALVKLGAIATIEPGVGATSFAGVVIITMIASHSFDSRLIWDRLEPTHVRH